MKMHKILSLVLASLILFGTGIPSKAKAETRPLNMKSIFIMTEEEAAKKVRLSDVLLQYFLLYNTKFISLPVIMREMRIEADDNASYTAMHDWIIKSTDFREVFYNSEMPNGLSVGTEFMAFKEISSGEIVYIWELRHYYDSEMDAYGVMPVEFVNEKFFQNIDYERYKREGVGTLKIYDPNTFRSYEAIRRLKLDKNQKISLSELVGLYKKAVTRDHWPVEEILKKNSNLNMPKFEDDFLTSTELIDKNCLLVCLFTDNKSYQIENMLLLYINEEDRTYRDLLTGEKVIEISTRRLNTKYLNSIGVKSKTFDISTINNKISFSGIVAKNDNERGYMLLEMGVKFQTIKTIGDALEIYFYLPEGFEPDYSHYDFSKNPNVDPAWLATRPTPPPYDELTIGSQGQEVLAMKQRFYELGYFRTDQFSDQFNANTADTVKQFEKNNGLAVDGVADVVMLGVLFSDGAVGK